MAKLKFNYLELQTKSLFLDRLMNAEEWARLASDWTPADIRAMEQRVDTAKSALKEIKGDVEAAKAEIKKHASAIVKMGMRGQMDDIRAMAEECRRLLAEIGEMERAGVSDVRPLPELQAIKIKQAQEVAEKRAKLEQLRRNKEQLARLLSHHRSEVSRLGTSVGEAGGKLEALKADVGHVQAQVVGWLREVNELCTEASRMRCEMIRPDYLLVTISSMTDNSSLPVHLSVDPKTGRLLSCQIGSSPSTMQTPKGSASSQWKEVVDAAIDANDIPFLVRQISLRINGSSK